MNFKKKKAANKQRSTFETDTERESLSELQPGKNTPCRPRSGEEKEFEIDMLIAQRNQLVKSIDNANTLFHRILFTVLTGMVSIIVGKELTTYNEKISTIFILMAIQIIILLVLFIEIVLCGANSDRQDICGIDDYLNEEYGVTCMFYEGYLSVTYSKGLFSIGYIIAEVILLLALGWFVIATGLYMLIWEDPVYFWILMGELIALIWYAFKLSQLGKKTDKTNNRCYNYLNRGNGMK